MAINRYQLKAICIAERVFRSISVNEGMREEEVAVQIKSLLKKFNAKPAFRVIVASGKRSALPHGFAARKKIRGGDLVVIDFGALYNGYRSDMTRTFMVGKPSTRQKKVYRVVKEAQRRALKTVRPGAVCRDVDLAAREYIEKQGFGRYFVHSTGHGVGRRVHQAPKISKKNKRRIREGMVLAIEPGIYIKGWGGVRIEDMVLVTKRGIRVLTRTPK